MSTVPFSSLVRVHVRPEEAQVSHGHAVLRSGRDGMVTGGTHGLYATETRVLSRWCWSVPGRTLKLVSASPVEQHAWLGYLGTAAPPVPEEGGPLVAAMGHPMSDHTLELRLARWLGTNLHEDVTLTNWSRAISTFDLVLEVDADFAAQHQVHEGEEAFGAVSRSWREAAPGTWELTFDWEATRTWEHQGQVGVTTMRRWSRVRFHRCSTPPVWEDGRVRFRVQLPPRGTWHTCVDVTMAEVSDVAGAEDDHIDCASFRGDPSTWDHRDEEGVWDATKVEDSADVGLTPIVLAALDRARRDLAALRLRENGSWTIAAGSPLYLALFGRDVLTTAWQAAMLDPEPLLATLETIVHHQGEKDDPWFDEEPGKMLHERHLGPLSVLRARPQAHYYGSITTSAFFPVAVGQAWHWLGDLDRVARHVEPSLRALRWLDARTRRDDGFYYYRTASEQGVRHQAWKDSPYAIVREDGSDVAPPIAASEEQGFVYLAKLQLAEVLWWLDRQDEARRLFDEAQELRERFDEAFWMPEEGTYALALDGEGRQVRAIASNVGHCLACGIVPKEKVGRVVGRLLAPDMFSGWGIRTLSSDNPAYNPFSYHRGSVWPVENGTFVLGFVRYGLHAHAAQLARAIFESTALFPALRLPEAFAGHPRDFDHPFPPLYPDANAPQAWSASAVVCVLQGLLGLYPYAPLHLLLVDPHLPEWLPSLCLRDLRVGDARVTLRFERDARGRTRFTVEDLKGTLRVVRQPSPWSLTAGPFERARDLLESLKGLA